MVPFLGPFGGDWDHDFDHTAVEMVETIINYAVYIEPENRLD